MNTTSKIALGLVSGAVLGGAIGLLFSPNSGEKNREIVKEKAESLFEKASELKSTLESNLADLGEDEKKRLESLLSRVDEFLSDLKDQSVNSSKSNPS